MRECDTGGRDVAFVAQIVTNAEESESMYVWEIRHVAKMFVHPRPTTAQSEVLDGRKLALLKQNGFLPIEAIREID